MTGRRRVAVLLNRRAQGVTAARIRWFRGVVPSTDLFITDGEAEGEAAIRAVVAAGYDVLCPGGGDGTFMATAATLLRLAPTTMPALLPLRLGTGNAVHDVCGAARPTPRGLTHDLARAADPRAPATPLRLLEVDGRLTQFAGVGLDADWQADYTRMVKRRVGNGALLPLARGVPGYLATALGLTIPRLIRRPHVTLTVRALGPARRLAADGATVADFADGAVLFEGPATLAAASTVPSYSAGFRFFPHVDQIGAAFELKVGVASLGDVVRGARAALGLGGDDGAASSKILDFAATGLRLELPEAAQYHVGGDVHPPVHGLTIRLASGAVLVLRPPAR